MVVVAAANTPPSSGLATNGSSKVVLDEDKDEIKKAIEEEDEEEEEDSSGSSNEDEVEESPGDLPPEGGWGWVVVFGVFVVYWLVPGMIRSYGAIYLEVIEAFPDSSASTAGWIPAFLSSISIGLAPVSAVLGKLYTCRNVVFVGGCLCSIGLITSYFATSIFFLFISFGLVTGIGAGLCTTPSVIVINSYFNKKRALASGICQSGAAIGSFTLPILVKILVSEYSLRGAFLIMGGIVLNVCAVSLLFTQDGKWLTKRPAKPVSKVTNGEVVRAVNQPRTGSIIRANNVIGETHDARLKEALLNPKLTPLSLRKSSLLHYPNSLSVPNRAMPRSASFAVQASSGAGAAERGGPGGDREVQRMSSSFSCSVHDISTASVFVSHPGSILGGSRKSSKWSVNDIPSDNLQKKSADGAEEQVEAKPSAWEHMMGFMKMCLDFSLFKESTYLVTVISASFIAGGFPHVLFFVPAYAHTLGVSKVDSSMLVSICSGVDLVGRIIYGWFMDLHLIRRSHGLALTCAICAIGTLCIPAATSYAMLAVFTAMYGFGSGSSFMLLPVILADNHGVEKLPSTYGLMRLFQGSVMLLIPPIAGFLKDTTGVYDYCFIMMGGLFMAAAIVMSLLPLAQRHDRKKQLKIENTNTGSK